MVLVATLIPFLPATAKLLQPLSVAFVFAFVAFVVEIVRDDCRAQPQQPCEPDQILKFSSAPSLAILARIAAAAGWLLGDFVRRHERRGR